MERGRRLEEKLANHNKANQETQMSVFIYQICNEGKSLADFELSELKCSIHFMLEKYKLFTKRINQLEEVFCLLILHHHQCFILHKV